jgi:hypothetical protein
MRSRGTTLAGYHVTLDAGDELALNDRLAPSFDTETSRALDGIK